MRLGDLFIHTQEEGFTVLNEESVAELANIHVEDVPEEIGVLKTYLDSSDNRRSSFRVDLTKLAPEDYQRLHMAVISDSVLMDVRPINISLTGVYVESQKIAVEESQNVVVRIVFDGHIVVICGSVVRICEAKRHFALHFPDVVAEDGSLTPPYNLSYLVGNLESLWLNSVMDLQ